MAIKVGSWEKPKNLKFYFTPTRMDRYNEIRKAEVKNHNLPILQYWYHGNERKPMHCLISKQPGFLNFPHIVTGQKRQRFTLDFNHIRQRAPEGTHPGFSVDKCYTPSGIFRDTRLDQRMPAMVEMMATMPINTLYHTFISQDSSKDDITLLNFKRSTWPWGLRNQKNFDKFCARYNLDLDYKKFLAVLCNIDAPCIVEVWKSGELAK